VTFDSTGLASVTVTINTTGTQTAQFKNPAGVFAAIWLGMPGIVLIGSLRGKKLSRKTIAQFLGMLLILVALLQGVGCGGGFTRTPTGTGTPTGSYQVLVQGTGTDGLTYSAVVPVNVGHQ
jgi:hypothetical protein